MFDNKNMKNDHFQVKGMTCAACQAHVDKAVRSLPGVNDVNVNLLTNSMDVIYDETTCNPSIISNSVKKAGYKAIVTKDRKILHDNNKSSLIKLIIAFVLLIALMYVSMGHMVHLPMPPLFTEHEYAIYYYLIQFALTIPVVVIYFHFFINGFKRLFKSPNMDTLIALGATASMVYSIFAFVRIIIANNAGDVDTVMFYHHNIYLDSVVMILTFVSLGKYLEELSKRRTTRAIESLVDLSPKTARRVLTGSEETVPVENINIGDIVLIKTGEAIPIDGIIIEGEGTIEESNITGESIPVYKKIEGEVYASTILKSGYLKVKATKQGQDSTFNTIIKLVEEASSSKAPISRFVDKVSLIFVPTIIGIALVTFITHLIIQLTGSNPSAFEVAFNYGVSILVVACPCALGLATPVSIMVSSGKGAKLGLIIRNAEILQKAGEINTIVMDKTGTITKGHPEVTDELLLKDREELLSIVNAIESYSKHPLAEALIEYTKEYKSLKNTIEDFKDVPGQGLVGKVNKDIYYIGNLEGVGDNKSINEKIYESYQNYIKSGKTALFLKKNDEVLGVFAIRDEIRETSKQAIKNLQDMGIEVIMLTGDKKETTEAIANELNIKNVIAEVKPIDKSDIILSLKDQGKKVAMVGDGVNDALALTNADVGISMGGGSDAAIQNSDIILIKKDLEDIYNAIRLSKRTMITIKIALFWAFFYNCIGVILAAGIIPGITLNPMICSLAMSFSSVCVVLTALSINLFKRK